MNRRTTIVVGAAAAAVVAGLTAGGVAAAAGSGSDDSPDVPITGDALTRASEAALAETGGGEVADTEVESDENGYEVEVNLADGSQVEVQLDGNFAVVGSSENEEGDDGDAD
jgi:uncharacterized membrane protein YkoI